MKYSVGDKVKIVACLEDPFTEAEKEFYIGKVGRITLIKKDYPWPYVVDLMGKVTAWKEEELSRGGREPCSQ